MHPSGTTGLVVAFLNAYAAFVGVFAGGVTLVVLSRPSPASIAVSRLASGVLLALGCGVILLAALFLVHRPILMGLLRSGRLRSRAHSQFLGGVLALLPFGAGVFLFRDGETLAGLAAFWMRVPSELAVGLLPYVVSGALFGAHVRRLVQDEGRRRTGG